MKGSVFVYVHCFHNNSIETRQLCQGLPQGGREMFIDVNYFSYVVSRKSIINLMHLGVPIINGVREWLALCSGCVMVFWFTARCKEGEVVDSY